MANKKVTDLQLRGSVEAILNFPTDDASQTYRVTAQQIKDFVLSVGSVTKSAIEEAQRIPSGLMAPFAGSTAPPGWLLCYGQAISRIDYADLFAAIGETHGSGDGSTTFNVPDRRGRVSVGRDDMGGVAANRVTSGGSGINGTQLGAVGGAQNVTLTESQMPSHTHIQNAHAHPITWTASNPNVGAKMGGPRYSNTSDDQSTTAGTVVQNATATNQNTGGDQAHNNMQPSAVDNTIIKI